MDVLKCDVFILSHDLSVVDTILRQACVERGSLC